MATAEHSYDKWLEKTKEKYPSHCRGGRLERFAEAMKSNSAFQSIYCSYPDRQLASRPSDDVDEVDAKPTSSSSPTTEPSPEQKVQLLHVLFEAARKGCCVALKEDMFDTNIIDVNLTDEFGITALHVAVENCHYEDVKFLLGVGAEIKADNQGLTPLHTAASSTKPNPNIATALIGHVMKNKALSLINAQISETGNEESTEGNTALHCAADNKYISREFIEALETHNILDPSVKNNNRRTAFHVAARAENADVIVSMLEVFTPAKTGWEMASIETETHPTLLEICAKKGDAAAVALLIKYGANVSQNIFFDLIDESVNNPTKTDKLIGVYRTLTEHCVLWKWLTEMSNKPTASSQHYPRHGTEPKAFAEKQREIMLDLLTKSNEGNGGRNVLEHAIVKGDRLFLNEIVNTLNVFRMTNYVSNSPEGESKTAKYDVTYDITGFLNSRPCRPMTSFTIMCCRKPTAVGPAPANGNSTHKRCYLSLISENKHLWENTDILQLEPFHTITQPMCWFVQLIYLAMAVIQLIHVIFFSVYFFPSYCSLKQKLNPDILAECNFSVIPPEPSEVNVSELYAIVNSLWLLWPTVVWIGTVTVVPFLERKWLQIIYGYLSVRLLYAPVLWAWYMETFVQHKLNLSLTSLVHLFGWLVTLSFVISTMENASIFSFLLNDFVVKDIAFNFGIVFVFVLVSFSSAIHLLRESALLGQSDYYDTMYNVFASALTTGDFMSETTEKSADDVTRYHLLRAMFAIYLCCATIILLNILITMMNHRYEEARRKAQKVWRFRSVRSYLCFGFTLTKTVKIMCKYWKITTHKLWKLVVNTTYDEVSIENANDGDEVLLHLKYTT